MTPFFTNLFNLFNRLSEAVYNAVQLITYNLQGFRWLDEQNRIRYSFYRARHTSFLQRHCSS
jgi:hypothetical protein